MKFYAAGSGAARVRSEAVNFLVKGAFYPRFQHEKRGVFVEDSINSHSLCPGVGVGVGAAKFHASDVVIEGCFGDGVVAVLNWLMYFELTDHFVVCASVTQTWDFFSAAENLPRITPPVLGFKIQTAMPLEMKNDVLLDYTIRWMSLPVRWRTRIIDWTPPGQFIDLQLRGPYTLWHHQHRFVKHDAGTECFDRVIYKLPFGILGSLTHAMVVRRQLLDIFRYRREAIGRLLGEIRPQQADVRVRRL